MSSKKKTSEKSEQSTTKQTNGPSKPPIDFYGVQPTFYIQGDEKNSSWIGCLCTVVLAAVALAVTLYYFLIFVRKEDMTVYSSVKALEKFPFVNLSKRKFILVVRGSYPEDGPYRGQFDKFFTFRAF